MEEVKKVEELKEMRSKQYFSYFTTGKTELLKMTATVVAAKKELRIWGKEHAQRGVEEVLSG